MKVIYHAYCCRIFEIRQSSFLQLTSIQANQVSSYCGLYKSTHRTPGPCLNSTKSSRRYKMARSRISATTVDAMNDSGSLLLSLIRGEQSEVPISLDFVKNAADPNLEYEAVIVEGLNDGAGSRPITIEPNGVQTVLSVRLPNYVGVWDPDGAYSHAEVVRYENLFYEKLGGIAIVDATPPDVSAEWGLTTLDTIHVQIPKTLSITPPYAMTPTVDAPVYGFFELRVSEKANNVYPRTWKPVRGLIEILFSPTERVPDV
jgi:hypothetical protein